MNAPRDPERSSASVRDRLLQRSRELGTEFQLLLVDFAIERFLYRLGNSRHRNNLVLKGAMLFRLWSDERRRATWDLDLLGRGADNVSDIVDVVREICVTPCADGLEFDVDSVKGETIRAANEYAGVRVRLEARLAQARIPMQIDVGFGDAVTPPPIQSTYPTHLDHEPPEILAYPREAVVAEKLEAMISLGVTNSRIKDFFDVHALASSFEFRGQLLTEAIRATFERRGTSLPDETPIVLTREFLNAPARRATWKAFLRRGRLDGPDDPADLSESLQQFLTPALRALSRGGSFTAHWSPGGPWVME